MLKDITVVPLFIPEVHIEGEVHELLTDFRHGEDIQSDAH